MARIIKAKEMQGGSEHKAVVLRVADLAEEARQVVLDARKQAARIIADARQSAEQMHQAAAEQGRAEGYARGENDGYAEGQRRGEQQAQEKFAAELGELTNLAKSLLGELAAARADLLHQARGEMLDFALMLAGKIVGEVATADVSVAKANLAKVLELAGQGAAMTVQVHPDQLSALRDQLKELVDALAVHGEVRLAADAGISAGGVKLLTRQGEIDATIETQLANVAEALLGRRRPSEQAGEYEPVKPRHRARKTKAEAELV